MRNKVSVFACFGIALSLSLVAAEGGHKNGYSSRDGKVYVMKEGKESHITAEVSFGNGSRLLPDGFIVFRDGRRERFRDSQWMSFEGEYVLADVVVADADDFDGYYFEAGRVYVYRDHRPVLITIEITFGDGSRISPDGSFYSHDGKRSHMSEGQRVSKVGKAVEGKHTATAKTPAAPTTNKTPATPIDADHKTTEPAKTSLPEHKEKDVSPSPAQERLTTPAEPSKTRKPEHNEKAEKPERAHEKPATPSPATEKKSDSK